MPIVQSLMDKLVAQYGEERGKRVYYAMEAEGSGPFKQGGKHRALHEEFAREHGVPPTSKGTKKARPGPKRRSGPKGRGQGRR